MRIADILSDAIPRAIFSNKLNKERREETRERERERERRNG
jgi:hypothetical protein